MAPAVERLALDGGAPAHAGSWPAWPQPTEDDAEAVAAIVRAGTWCSAAGGHAEVAAFEAEFAAMHAAPPGPGQPDAPVAAVAVTNGTSALVLAMQAAGVGPGDEVVVPPYTFIATASAALLLGAVPVFADVDPDTLCLDPASARAAIGPRTKAVVPVHFAGCPADLEGLSAVCRETGVSLIEDACQAPGAAWAGRPVGAWGQYACFSFQESKNLSSGEGGAVLARGADADLVWSLHNVGRTRGGAWYGHDLIGWNHRLTALQAALLRSQLRRFPAQAARRAAAAAELRARMAEIPGVRPTNPPAAVTAHAWHLFPFRIDTAAFGGRSRDQVLAALRAEGVPASRGYVLLAENEAILEARRVNAERAGTVPQPDQPLPVARAAVQECCWLGQNILLAAPDAVAAIPAALAKIQRAWG